VFSHVREEFLRPVVPAMLLRPRKKWSFDAINAQTFGSRFLSDGNLAKSQEATLHVFDNT
jgi:hypothetical protein